MNGNTYSSTSEGIVFLKVVGKNGTPVIVNTNTIITIAEGERGSGTVFHLLENRTVHATVSVPDIWKLLS